MRSCGQITTFAVGGESIMIAPNSTYFFVNQIHELSVPHTETTTLGVCRAAMILIGLGLGSVLSPFMK